MVECWLPYGRTEVHISVPLTDLIGVAEPRLSKSAPNMKDVILGSLRNPVGSKALGELAEPGVPIAIAIDGTISPRIATAAVSSIVEELKLGGASVEDTTIVVGNGCRGLTDQELLEALKGHEALMDIGMVEQSRTNHNLVEIGTTSRETRLEVNNRLAGAGLRIAVGEVLLDAFTGFRGAHTTVLPAISGVPTIQMNRSLAFDEKAAPGVVEGNPVLADVLEAARLVKIDFAVNLIEDAKGKLLGACSGDLEESWRQAVSGLGDSFRVEAEANADVIVVSAGGIKFDFDLYHGVWALHNVSKIAKRGATIILLVECSEGIGAPGLIKLSHIDRLSELRRRFMLGGEAVHLIKSTLRSNRVVLVSALPGYVIEPLGLSPARTANDALDSIGQRRKGRRTLVVTNGCATMPMAS